MSLARCFRFIQFPTGFATAFIWSSAFSISASFRTAGYASVIDEFVVLIAGALVRTDAFSFATTFFAIELTCTCGISVAKIIMIIKGLVLRKTNKKFPKITQLHRCNDSVQRTSLLVHSFSCNCEYRNAYSVLKCSLHRRNIRLSKCKPRWGIL